MGKSDRCLVLVLDNYERYESTAYTYAVFHKEGGVPWNFPPQTPLSFTDSTVHKVIVPTVNVFSIYLYMYMYVTLAGIQFNIRGLSVYIYGDMSTHNCGLKNWSIIGSSFM